jgi:hypothetical protein
MTRNRRTLWCVITVQRLLVWLVVVAAIVAGLLCAGVDAISGAFFVGWGTLVAITCQYVSVKAGGIVSGSIAAVCVGLAIVERALYTHPAPSIEWAVIVMPAAFAIGYALPCAISVLGNWIAKRGQAPSVRHDGS